MTEIDIPLFEVENPPIQTPPRKRMDGKPRWSKYRPKNPLKCDDCMLVLALAKGNGPAAHPARWRRVINGDDLLLCYGHAEERRREDGLKPLSELSR